MEPMAGDPDRKNIVITTDLASRLVYLHLMRKLLEVRFFIT